MRWPPGQTRSGRPTGCGSSADDDAAGGAGQKPLSVAVDGPRPGVVPQRGAGEKLKGRHRLHLPVLGGKDGYGLGFDPVPDG